ENNLFRILPPFFKTSIERTVFNRRKRRLMSYQNAIRMKLVASVNGVEDVFDVHSMPLEIGRLAGRSGEKVCKEELDSMPSKGDRGSQKMYYHGYKLHAACSLKGVFRQLTLRLRMFITFIT